MRFVKTILLLAALLTAPSYVAAADDSLLDIQVVKSDSGIEAWLARDHSIPILSLSFAFKDAGSAQNSAEKQGLARMLSNTLDEGAGDLNSQDFQKELQDLSIGLSFSASRDHFSGQLKTLTKNQPRAFELLKLALTQPRFDEEAIERMRRGNQSRIRSSLSNPKWLAARILNDVAFAGHPYALNSGGTLSSLEGITAADLRSFHTSKLGRNNLIVSASGDITAEDLKIALDNVFGSLPTVETTTSADLQLQNQGSISLYKKDIPQTVIEMMQPGLDRKDPDYHTAQVLNFVLGSSGFGSRLTEEIREKRGLTYGIYSYFFDLNHLDGFSVSTSTQNENVPEMLSLIKAEFQKMLEKPITDQELSDAKSYLIGSLPLSLTSTDKISGLLLSLQLDDLPQDYLIQRRADIEKSSVSDVQRVALKLLKPDSFVTILVGEPAGDLDVNVIEAIPNAE